MLQYGRAAAAAAAHPKHSQTFVEGPLSLVYDTCMHWVHSHRREGWLIHAAVVRTNTSAECPTHKHTRKNGGAVCVEAPLKSTTTLRQGLTLQLVCCNRGGKQGQGAKRETTKRGVHRCMSTCQVHCIVAPCAPARVGVCECCFSALHAAAALTCTSDPSGATATLLTAPLACWSLALIVCITSATDSGTSCGPSRPRAEGPAAGALSLK